MGALIRTGTSLLGAYLLASGTLRLWPESGMVRPFVVLWVLQFFSSLAWSIVFYPKFFSPLRHLPGPRDGSFFMGQFADIRRYPTGVPQIKW